ncbi:hypothetical protein [Sebaldella sp. S0638]|uniref:hypothetical protein n=1 Tax=Sebaldella sp. S0638 TaxID=2957809 RepID=UPI0020A0EB0D|nr:hypothetical protein [Sebaldella sp. S0638]MCP1226546.1 hypothetical protein [Sebaldella sp. S0638]
MEIKLFFNFRNYEKIKRVAENINATSNEIFFKARPMLKEHRYKVISVREKRHK